MAATTAYQAGIEANNVTMSYGIEAAWGVKPAIAFQLLRMTGETMALNRTRQRPLEINITREAAASVTTQEAASGAINFAFSYGTYDDLFAIGLGNEFTTPLAINGVAGDIILTNNTATQCTVTSGTAGKFTLVVAGTYIRLKGFTNAANNGWWYVSTSAALTIVLISNRLSVTETPAGTAAGIRGSTCVNGTEFRSFYLQKKLSSILYLNYPGAYISGFSLQGQLGQFFSGSFNIMAKDEIPLTAEGSTGAALVAPGGKVINPVSGYMYTLLNQAAAGAVIDQISMTVANTGAAGEYGLGSAGAQGMLAGYLEASGSFRAYFPDFTLYTLFDQETVRNITFLMQDANTDAYAIQFMAATLSDGKINAGGPGQPVYATYQFSADPLAAGTTMRIDKLPLV